MDLVDRINSSAIDHVVVTDHVSFRGGRGQDALTALHYLAGLGIDRPLHTGVLLLPLRHPTVVARQLLDLADIHPAGVVCGVGLGGDDPDEYRMMGMDSADRGKRMDEALALLLKLLAPQARIEHEGHYPITGPGLERGSGSRVSVVVGGRAEASYQRAAQADGWLAAFCSASKFVAGAQRVQQLKPHSVAGYQAWIGVGEDGRAHADAQIRRFYGIDPTHFERFVPVGGVDKLVEHFTPYVNGGATVLNLFPAGEPYAAVAQISAAAQILETTLCSNRLSNEA